ncbi:MAG: translational GTPase TypA [Bacteroidetes bacterium]|jgi:GTP-binding protein|nr:translational GTPase TypA [Bacteroidota bacterium]
MQSIRNVAIIAHVDHGKTTLVDKFIHAARIIDDRKEQKDLILDNNELERERGITILSKNVSVTYKDVKINIIDTPGHADFGGEVERVLKMADGVLLLVDAFEGPMPQTRFVLSKAIELGLKPIVVINKVDKLNCTPDLVHEKVFDLMFSLNATEEQLDFHTVYGSAKNGWMSDDWKKPTTNITPLFDAIIEHIKPAPFNEGTPQMQITSLDYTSYVGRIAIGRVFRGTLKEGQDYMLCKENNVFQKVRIKELHVFEGLGKIKVSEVRSGDICAIIGLDNFEIGDTIADKDSPEALERIEVDQPTMSMLFTINNSPFFGKEGKFVTSRHLRDRLFKEKEKNLALRVEETDSEEKFNVFGRGILHLSILIETMRREGYELQVGRPKVLLQNVDNQTLEPYETLVVDVPEESASKIVNLVTMRKGDLHIMEPKGDLQHLEFDIPSRGLIGLRSKMLTASAGEAIINHRYRAYDVYKGEFNEVINGAIISSEAGKATAHAIDRLQDRGRFFIDPNDEIYKGQVIGENTRQEDMAVNLIKGKKLTNFRAAGSDENTKIAPKISFSLEEYLEYIKDDEYLEITPKSLRLRKISFTGI